MNFLVVGLGSMGKRRIRCLKKLGFEKIYGYDTNSIRCKEAQQEYNIKIVDNIEDSIMDSKLDALIISVPPGMHHIYIKQAIKHNIHFFVEASVVDDGYDEIINNLQKKDIVAAPSATTIFKSEFKIIYDLINSGELGKISNVIHHKGQFLPDWHPYEDVKDYYVSNPLTGGAREIVPFELMWITKLFGFPKMVCGNFRKTINIAGAEKIDDTYNCLLDYEYFFVNLIVDVVSRYPTRRMLINGSHKQLIWDYQNPIKLYDPIINEWKEFSYEIDQGIKGYGQNISEKPYVDELLGFVDAIKGRNSFPNNFENDWSVLKLLYTIEDSDKKSKILKFNK